MFEDLAADNSRLFKIAKLKEYKDDKLLACIFNMGLDPYTNYYIRKMPEYTPNDPAYERPISLETALKDITKLSDRTFTGYAGVEHLRAVLSCVEQDHAKVIERIINRDFKCGVSASTINKVFPNLISEYPCMLASSSNQKLLDKILFPAAFEMKMDGMRFNAICRNNIEFRGRSGKPLDFKNHLLEDFNEIRTIGEDFVYDGELWVDDGTGNPLPRKVGNGICTKAIRGTISEEEAALIRVTLWDKIPYQDWLNERCEIKHKDRFEDLKKDVNKSSGKIHLIEQHIVNDMDEVYELFDSFIDRKEEGGILKNRNSIWESKRSKEHIKFKMENSADLLCVGWTPGKNKYEGMIGNLLLESSDKKVTVSCGSGLKDDDRKKDPSHFVGNIIEIVYNEKIIDSNGDMSLFLPIFKFVRHDKNEANSESELK